MAFHNEVNIPYSRVKEGIVKILKEEGYIRSFDVKGEGPAKAINVGLKYYKGNNVIRGIQRVSTPGRRRYTNLKNMPIVRSGIGISVITTSKGIMSDTSAKDLKIGGEIICKVW